MNSADHNADQKAPQGPSDWMRARRPYLFSDSRLDPTLSLPKPIFEYHLETLTSRKQEYEFEHFCRRLAEKEICPNLRVQTGPTGGGDSKVDTETYPVATEIAERWWAGNANSGHERWAFAFSTKKDWKAKLKADVDNILSTDRNYALIYFITNQFVSDKQRAKYEDALSRTAQIPVHILDRTWIVEKVYTSGHLALAADALKLAGVHTDNVVHFGPRDSVRIEELKTLDSQIVDPQRYAGARYQLVEDSLHSAILARGLARPRNEVEARFAHSDTLAQDLNYPPQRLRIHYSRAWTAYWWYEDYLDFLKFYDAAEQMVSDSSPIDDIFLLLNLWQILTAAINAKTIDPASASVTQHTHRLTSLFQLFAEDASRPIRALEAHTGLVMMKVTKILAAGSPDELASCWQEFSKIIDQSTTLVDYPLRRLADIIFEFANLGEHVESEAFDALYENTVLVVHQRTSDGDAGHAYCSRGIQKLKQGKPYDAIRYFGRAEALLSKEEFREELARVLYMSSHAYERVGLLWAARNKALAAVERNFTASNRSGVMSPPTLRALQRLVWIELQLGRIPHILKAIELADLIAGALNLPDEPRQDYIAEREMQESVLGIHFLNLNPNALTQVQLLPDVLRRLNLSVARTALLYALGYEDTLREEEFIPQSDSSTDVYETFVLWHDQPARKDISTAPLVLNDSLSPLETIVLGSKLILLTPNDPTSLGLAESILGAFEAFLSTSDETAAVPHREQTVVKLKRSDHVLVTPQLTRVQGPTEAFEIVYSDNFRSHDLSQHQAFMQWLQSAVIEIAMHLFIVQKPLEWVQRLEKDENAFFRAFALSDMLTVNGNVFGDSTKLNIAAWTTPEDRSWMPVRTLPWRTTKSSPAINWNDKLQEAKLKFGEGSPPPDLFDHSQLKHSERRVVSPINLRLWDQAQWSSTMYVLHPNEIPILAIGFADASAGRAIFEEWRSHWGECDEQDMLRVAFIRGLTKHRPTEYAVLLGANQENAPDAGTKTLLFVSRYNRMTSVSTVNLSGFLSEHIRAGAFHLMPAHIGAAGPQLFHKLSIRKKQVLIREAWQIGTNDPDIAVLDNEDEPIIPLGIVAPPITKALEIRRKQQNSMPRKDND